MQKEKVYVLRLATESEIKRAEKIQQMLYNKFKSVRVEIVGLCEIKITASDKIA